MIMAYMVIANIVMAYIVMAFIVMAYIVMAYVAMAYTAMAYKVMAYRAKGCMVKARHGPCIQHDLQTCVVDLFFSSLRQGASLKACRARAMSFRFFSFFFRMSSMARADVVVPL